MYTIDASVWINADSPGEPGQPESRALLDAVFRQRIPIVSPTLLPVELAGAIARTRGDLRLAEQLALAIFSLPNIRWIGLDEALARQAVQLAAAHRLRGADAVYASVALAHHCELVSLDREHLSRLTTVVNAMTPVAALARLSAAPPGSP